MLLVGTSSKTPIRAQIPSMPTGRRGLTATKARTEVAKGYKMTEFKEDVKKCLMKCGVEDKAATPSPKHPELDRQGGVRDDGTGLRFPAKEAKEKGSYD